MFGWIARLFLIVAPQAVGAPQSLVGRVVLVQPLRRLHHVCAVPLQFFNRQFPGLLVELFLLELLRELHLRDAPLLPVDLADQDDDDNHEDGSDEAGTVHSHCRISSFKPARDSTDEVKAGEVRGLY